MNHDDNERATVEPKRSALMQRVRRQHTAPELRVRKALHAMGFRYRLHAKNLPGRPDIILPRFRAAIFVHGCFWHRHAGCSRSSVPKTRQAFWEEKFRANVARDQRNKKDLQALGWR